VFIVGGNETFESKDGWWYDSLIKQWFNSFFFGGCDLIVSVVLICTDFWVEEGWSLGC
jgi:hypothetical protein